MSERYETVIGRTNETGEVVVGPAGATAPAAEIAKLPPSLSGKHVTFFGPAGPTLAECAEAMAAWGGKKDGAEEPRGPSSPATSAAFFGSPGGNSISYRD